MERLVIHAGFPKTGSSSIQRALGVHLPQLSEAGMYMLGREMDLEEGARHPGLPLWYIEDAWRNWPEDRNFGPQIKSAFAERPGSTLIVSSENLDQPGMPRLFKGLDDEVKTEVVFYFRPQWEWIPSGWKQWAAKTGMSLDAFIDHCLQRSQPASLSSLDEWAATFPKADIVAVPFFRDSLIGGDVAIDFFARLGFRDYRPELMGDPVNPSMDYSLLHLLMRVARTNFEGIHDNRLSDALLDVLPSRYHSTNIEMITFEAAQTIEAHFRDENLEILARYTGVEDVAGFYDAHFSAKPRADSYMEKCEQEILQRAFGILSEIIGTEKSIEVLEKMLRETARYSPEA